MNQKAYKFRLLPNKTQEVLLVKTFGCCRHAWNDWTKEFNKPANEERYFKSVKELRSEHEWMKEVSACAIQQKERDFDQFKKQFFSKTRKKKVGRPKRKYKDDKQAFRMDKTRFNIKENKIQLEKLGLVKCVFDRTIPEDVKFVNCTVSKDSVGDYFISINVEENNIKQLPKTGKVTGIDVGLSSFLTHEDGTVVDNPRFFNENQAELKRIQQHLSRKVKGSNRREKCRQKVAKIHRKTVRQRNHFLHNLSKRLVEEYDLIAVETLDIEEMRQNPKFAKGISDASWNEFIRQLEYKCSWYGKELRKAPRFEPTTKKCYVCGYINHNLTIEMREWDCPCCNKHHFRDQTGAINTLLSVGTDTELQTWREYKTSGLPTDAFLNEASIITEDLESGNLQLCLTR